jgi:hypothetical protein
MAWCGWNCRFNERAVPPLLCRHDLHEVLQERNKTNTLLRESIASCRRKRSVKSARIIKAEAE